jgi:hypothetical protein
MKISKNNNGPQGFEGILPYDVIQKIVPHTILGLPLFRRGSYDL